MFDFPICDPVIPVQQGICAPPLIMHCPRSDAFAAIRVHLMLNAVKLRPITLSIIGF